MKNETKVGNEWRQTISIVDLPGIIVPMHYPVNQIVFTMEINRLPVCKINLEFGVSRVCSEQRGYQYTIKDIDGDSFLSTTDEIIVEGTEKNDHQELVLYDNTDMVIGGISWYNGMGVVTGAVRETHIEYSISRSSSSNITLTIDKMYGQPGLMLSGNQDPYKFNAKLFEDYFSIMNKTLADGFLGISNGTVLRFVDHDKNNFLNAGDRFENECKASKYYKLRLTGGILYRERTIDLEWKT